MIRIELQNHLLSLSEITYFKEMEDLEFRLGEIIKKYSYMSYEQVDISAIMTEAFKVIGRYGLAVPSNLFTLIKSLATIQNLPSTWRQMFLLQE